MAPLHGLPVLFASRLFLLHLRSKHTSESSFPLQPRRSNRLYLSHHVLPIDESLKSTNRCRVTQREHVLGLDGNPPVIGVFLENDDLKEESDQTRYGLSLPPLLAI